MVASTPPPQQPSSPKLPPERLHQWTTHGFSVGLARRWIGKGFRIAAADQWRNHGVYAPEEAVAWQEAGISPYEVADLLQAGMTPKDIVHWRELGYSPPEALARHIKGEKPQPRIWWKELFNRHEAAPSQLPPAAAASMQVLLQAGVPAAAARMFIDTGWQGVDAVPWAKASINPTQAAVYRELGIQPGEATRLAKAGYDALSILRTWWDGGIPRTEVAAWLGAGFTPAEAAQARTTGTSVEQAAVLRALGGVGKLSGKNRRGTNASDNPNKPKS